MTANQLRKAIERLGTNQIGLASALGVPARQLRRWLASERDIPPDISQTIELLLGDIDFHEVFRAIEDRVDAVRLALENHEAARAA